MSTEAVSASFAAGSQDVAAPSSPSAGPRLAKRVLLVGWDAADWQIIHPLLDSGQLPALAKFLGGGVMGNLATLQPILSPMLWNSIATGKRPHKHGIHGFLEVLPDASGIRPVSSASRRTKALWNILTQRGLKSQVFGWFASHPAEPIDGVCVSNLYRQAPAGESGPDAPWPLPPRSVHPPRLEEILADLRVHPGEIEAAHLLPFIPMLGQISEEEGNQRKGLEMAVKLLADCASIHAAATWALENEPWDFAAVYYDSIDHFCHGFMPFHPPRLPEIDERTFELYRDVVTGAYKFHDMMLERLLQLAGEDATVLLVSDHGFFNNHLRPDIKGPRAAGPVGWHRPYGVFAMRGPGILADERIHGATLLDVAPTVLTLFGLPVGEDMDGKPLVQAFAQPPEIRYIRSWDDVPGEAGTLPPGDAAPDDPEAAQQALQQLVELGYVEPLSQDAEKQVRSVGMESRYNLALALIDANLPGEAIALLEALTAQSPERRFRMTLAQACLSAGRVADARRALEPIMTQTEPDPEAPTADPGPSGAKEETLIDPATEPDQQTATPPQPEYLLGVLAAAESRYEEALEHFLRAEQRQPRLPRLHNQLGYMYLRLRRWPEAERAFRTALTIDGDSARASHGLSVALLRQERFADAAEMALRAVGLQHFFPAAHFQLGLVLARLDWPQRAAQAFETGLTMRPGAISAHRYLARLYARMGQTENARRHREIAAAKPSAPTPARDV